MYPLNLLISSIVTSCQYTWNFFRSFLLSFFLSFFLSFCSFSHSLNVLHCLPFIDDVTYAVYSQEMTQISTCAYRQILWHICLMHVLYMSTIKSNKYSLNQTNKAIHSLLMHGYATFNMLVPGTQNCCRHEMCTALSQNEHSPWK